MYNIVFTSNAETDLFEIVEYIGVSLKSPIAAKNTLDTIEAKIKTLVEKPLRCPFVHDEYLKSKGIRAMQVNNYQIFYHVNKQENQVIILRILFARRNWINLLQNNELN